MTDNPNDIVQVARYKLTHVMPYLHDAVFSLILVHKPGFKTMAVDKYWRCYYDEEIIRKQWTLEEVVGVLYHEINHLLREHHMRGEPLGPHNQRSWNVAGDLEINDDIDEISEFKLPDVAIRPNLFGWDNNLLAEQYYKLYKDQQQDEGQGEGEGDGQGGTSEAEPGPASGDCGSAADGQSREYEQPSPSEGSQGVNEAEAEIVRDKTADSIQEATDKRMGRVPGDLQRWAKKRKTKTIDWRKELRASIKRAIAQKSGATDYTMSRPSRRDYPDIVMPSLVDPMPRVAVVIDTSGSIGQQEVEKALTETGKILTSIGSREGITAISCDAQVHNVQRVLKETQIKLHGGGGTDMGRGIAAAAKLRPRVDICIVITDGYTPWPDRPPSGMKVIIALSVPHNNHATPKWAKTIVLKEPGDE